MRYISSQRYLHDQIVEEKKDLIAGNSYVEIPCMLVGDLPDFEHEEFAVVLDGHHTMAAAKELGIEIRYDIVDNQDGLTGDDLLLAHYMDSDWYDVETGVNVF